MTVLWLMRRKVSFWAGMVGVTVFGAALIAVVAGLVLLAYVAGYTTGNRHAYEQGQADGRAAACTDLANQVRWSNDTEKDMVTSKHDTPLIQQRIQSFGQASMHFVCDRLAASGPNLYDPSAPAPVVPLNQTPTLPKAAHQRRPSPILMSGLPKPKPSPAPKHGHGGGD